MTDRVRVIEFIENVDGEPVGLEVNEGVLVDTTGLFNEGEPEDGE